MIVRHFAMLAPNQVKCLGCEIVWPTFAEWSQHVCAWRLDTPMWWTLPR